MKIGQLIEYNLRNISVQKSYTKCGGETSPRPFSGKLKFSVSLDQSFKVLYSLFLSYCKLSAIKIETKLQATFFYLLQSIFF